MLYVKWPPRWSDDGDDDEDRIPKEYDNMPPKPPKGPPLQPAKPPHRWSKLIRFVPGPEIDNLLTSYDEVKNLLKINVDLYNLLPEAERLALWRLTSNTELTYGNAVKTIK